MSAIIYVVDDSKTLRLLMRTILSHEGFEVREFVNGEDVLEACGRQLPNLILLDILMPGIDGYEVCRQVRAMAMVPIIMLTTRAEPDERARGALAGANDYIAKPFDTADLLRRVQLALSGADAH